MTAILVTPPIIDTHTHLDDAAFQDDLDAVIEASRAAGVVRFINIAYSPESWESSRALRDRYFDVEVAIGLHPQQANRFGSTLVRDMSRAIAEIGVVAVGETGFDFSRSERNFKEQVLAFRGQLEIASTLGLPTIIHQRDAANALMTELDRWPDLAPIVLHSFDGTHLLADWAIERGCFIGLGGLAARRGYDGLRELVSRIPVDRLLLETDSPYLPPPGAARRNTPANVPIIARILAPLWNLSEEELRGATTANAIALFGLSDTARDAEVPLNGLTLESPIAHRDDESGEDS